MILKPISKRYLLYLCPTRINKKIIFSNYSDGLRLRNLASVAHCASTSRLCLPLIAIALLGVYMGTMFW